ncbi:MAG: zinc-binding dehydrogenase [Bradymonadaceae bacterium]|nr:zinc-binding dehydrogenase [Lujinxingiaceae bacterium]
MVAPRFKGPLNLRIAEPTNLVLRLLTAGGDVANRALAALRPGVEPEPQARPDVQVRGYDGDVDAEVIERLNARIEAGPFKVHVAQRFPLDQAAQAHRALNEHYLGKLLLRVNGRSRD